MLSPKSNLMSFSKATLAMFVGALLMLMLAARPAVAQEAMESLSDAPCNSRRRMSPSVARPVTAPETPVVSTMP